MYIDSHCHLNLDECQDDYKEAIRRAYGENVKAIINVGASLASSRRAIEIAHEMGNGIFATVGMHPHDACLEHGRGTAKETFDEQEFLRLARDEMVVAIGEMGLDYYEVARFGAAGSYFGDDIDKPAQKELLLKQISIAIQVDKPVIFHCREAYDDLIKVLQPLPLIPRGVIHCYVGNWTHAQAFLDMGFYISFTGIITFSKSDELAEVIKQTPLEKILIETDAPWLAPEPYRGQRNEPAYVVEVAKKIAEIKEISLDKVGEQTSENARKLFKLKLNEK